MIIFISKIKIVLSRNKRFLNIILFHSKFILFTNMKLFFNNVVLVKVGTSLEINNVMQFKILYYLANNNNGARLRPLLSIIRGFIILKISNTKSTLRINKHYKNDIWLVKSKTIKTNMPEKALILNNMLRSMQNHNPLLRVVNTQKFIHDQRLDNLLDHLRNAKKIVAYYRKKKSRMNRKLNFIDIKYKILPAKKIKTFVKQAFLYANIILKFLMLLRIKYCVIINNSIRSYKSLKNASILTSNYSYFFKVRPRYVT